MNAPPQERAVILVAHPDPRVRAAISGAVDGESVHVIRVEREAEAVNCLASEDVAVVIAPLRDGDIDGARLRHLAERLNDNAATILTVEPNTLDTDAAVRLMRDGAHDFLTRPVNTAKLRESVQKALRQQDMQRENRALQAQLEHPSSLLGFTGKSTAMRAVYDRLIRLASAPNTTVLITGESGAGKDVAARALHSYGPRRDGPYIPFNCAAVPDALFDSELFGHEEGSFTGASHRRRGRFELAHRGTLVLDEVAELSASAQAKLLRVLETGEVDRVGSEKPTPVDVRVVAVTNRDLAAEAQVGRFRNDLYHRLRVVTVHMPLLRDRVEDIPLLVSTFIEECAESTGRDVTGITPRAMRVLEQYLWPGNVRELKNSIEAMVVVAQSEVLDLDDMPDWLRGTTPAADGRLEPAPSSAALFAGPGAPAPPTETCPHPIAAHAGMTWGEIEREAIRSTLTFTGGNKAEAARVLAIGRRTLFRKIKEYSL
ncbi:sigma-54-dependent Fis family transcriptional regulator [Candidatus Poribacteria bacterium]|nr:sigma-54-dependent Fis family transcriptional regulator [Candidatus Poribacteria bacterium]